MQHLKLFLEMAKRLCGAKVLEMMANVDTSMEEDSSEDDTVDGYMNSSNVDSSEEDMEVSDAVEEVFLLAVGGGVR